MDYKTSPDRDDYEHNLGVVAKLREELRNAQNHAIRVLNTDHRKLPSVFSCLVNCKIPCDGLAKRCQLSARVLALRSVERLAAALKKAEADLGASWQDRQSW